MSIAVQIRCLALALTTDSDFIITYYIAEAVLGILYLRRLCRISRIFLFKKTFKRNGELLRIILRTFVDAISKKGVIMKKYSDSEEQKQTVNEPAAAYGLDLNSLKVETVQSVMQIENPRIVQEIRDYALRLMQEEEEYDYRNAPCQFTVEELKEELRKSREESRLGLGISNEEMMRRKFLH